MLNISRIAKAIIVAIFSIGGNTLASVTSCTFDTIHVFDSRQEAHYQNFADYGVSYIFKIISGRIYYSRNGIFKGEFSTNGTSHGVFKNYSVVRAGATDSAPAFSMVTARNNRVFAMGMLGGKERFFWACLVPEYKNDYKSIGAV